jgi:hypothetical protein
MAENTCANCRFRVRYNQNPRSLSGRFWRWHINFCPGWKAYFASLTPGEKARLADEYNFMKYQ